MGFRSQSPDSGYGAILPARCMVVVLTKIPGLCIPKAKDKESGVRP